MANIYGQKTKFDIYAGLLPADNYVIADNKFYNRDPFKTSKIMEPEFNNVKGMDNPCKIGEIEETKLAPALVEDKPKTRKKRGSIDGNNIKEITANIIKEKPTLKKIIKAYTKMAELSQNQKDSELFDFD